MVTDEKQARELEKKYRVSSKQYVDGELQIKLINKEKRTYQQIKEKN